MAERFNNTLITRQLRIARVCAVVNIFIRKNSLREWRRAISACCLSVLPFYVCVCVCTILVPNGLGDKFTHKNVISCLAIFVCVCVVYIKLCCTIGYKIEDYVNSLWPELIYIRIYKKRAPSVNDQLLWSNMWRRKYITKCERKWSIFICVRERISTNR